MSRIPSSDRRIKMTKCRIISSPGYEARQQNLCKAKMLNHRLCQLKEQLRNRQRLPMKVLKEVDELIDISNMLLRPLQNHRDELASIVYSGKAPDVSGQGRGEL